MHANLTQGIHRAAQQTPNRFATIFGSRKRTFTESVARIARLGAALQTLGMRPDDRVGMLALNSDRYFEFYMGVMWGGGVVNPCNTRWSLGEIVASLDDCDTKILLVDDHFTKALDTVRATSKAVRTIVHVGDGPTPAGLLSYEALLADATPVEDVRRSGDDMAGIFYTGGTTGTPKGVVLTHANIFASALALSAGLPSEDEPVYMHAAPMFHLADGAAGFMYLLRGATHTFVPSFTVEGMLAAVQATRTTAALLVPTMIQLVADHPAVGDYDLGSLRTLLYGASAMSEAVLTRAMKALPQARFIQAYGMTELSPVATILAQEYHVLDGPRAGRLRAAGRASQATEVKIVDPDEHEVPRGAVGEIVVRGPNVMKGYWNQPELTAHALRGGWMHTGDGGYMDEEGFVFVVDRLKDMIVTGGENVYSGEVENALMQHAGIAMCAVIAVPDEKWGERVHAVLVPKAGVELTQEAIAVHCKARLASYKCPRSIELRTELPLSGAGKILKAALRAPYWSGASRGIA
jgi:acyl-CoA synthetase (AMP-forming)/AMP-acid ligase II